MIGPLTVHGVDTAEYLPVLPLAFNPYGTLPTQTNSPSTPSGVQSLGQAVEKLALAMLYNLKTSTSNDQGYKHSQREFLPKQRQLSQHS